MEIRQTRVSTQPLQGTAPLTTVTAPLLPSASPVQETTARQSRDTNTLVASGEASELTLQAQDAPLGFEGNAHYQALKASGKLTPEVSAELARLATRPLAPGIDREALIAGTLRDLADPASINQGSRQTCAAAVIQTTLALDDPAGYLKLIGDLASPAGKATLANGDTLSREPGWRQNGGVSLTAGLIQPAFMQYATGGTYDSASDTRMTATGRQQGLYADEQNKLANAVTGKQTEVVFGNGAAVLGAVAATTAQGQPVAAVLKREDGKGHSVLIERIQGDKITYLDPHAGRVTCSLSEFQAQLQSVNLPKTRVSNALRAESEAIKAGGRGLLAGFFNPFEAVANVAKAVVAPVVQVVQAVVAPVVKVATGVAKAVGSVVTGSVNAVGSAVSNTINGIFQAGASFVQGIANIGGMLGEAWNKYGSYVMMGASVISMLVPGLQVVALAIAAYQAYQSGEMLLEGIRTGDLKKSLLGLAGMAAALSGGAGALGAKVLGGGAMAVANVAGKVGNVAKQIVAFTDAIQEGNPNKLLGAAASLLGEGAQTLGNGAEVLVKRATDFAEKANAYAHKAERLFEAISKGDMSVPALASALAADLVGDLGSNAEAQANLKLASTLFDAGTKGAVALQRGDWGQALDAALTGGEAISGTLPRNETLDKVMRIASLSAKGNDALQRQDVNGARGALQELGQELGFAIPGLEQLNAQNVHRVGGIFSAAQRGDVGQVFVLGAELSQVLGVQLPRHEILEKATRIASLSSRGNDALQRQDVNGTRDALQELGKELGFEIPDLEHLNAQNVHRVGGIFSAAQRGDVGQALRLGSGLSQMLGVQLPHPDILDNPELQRAARLATLAQQGDAQAFAKALSQELGLDPTTLPAALTSVLAGLGTLEATIVQGEEAAWQLRDQLLTGIAETLTQAEQVVEGLETRLGAVTKQCESAVKAFLEEHTMEAQKALEEAKEQIASLGKRWPFDAAFLAPLAQGAGPLDPALARGAMQQAEQLMRQTQEAVDALRTYQEGLKREATEIERALQAQSAAGLTSHLQAFGSATRQLVVLATV
ncbi:hypothetical protein J7643_04635 [bacterium]|nr:hypothetical protein [bacterium]